MTEALLVSNVLAWIAIVALAAVVVALTRQIGLLHERIAPVGALSVATGPEVGTPAPVLTLPDLTGEPTPIGGEDALGRRTLLFFLSPTCPVCETLLPTVKRLTRGDGRLRVVFASDGDAAEHRAFASAHGLDGDAYVLSRDLGMHYQVAKLPYAVLLDAGGVVRAKGLVNTREHVESLFEAEALGVASLQDWAAREDADRPTRIEVAS